MSAASLGLPIVDYKIAIASQPELLAQFQRVAKTDKDMAAYQSGVAKITTVDQFLADYKTLKTALTAYGLEDMINQKGMLKKLLTEDPTGSKSVAQRLGNQKYIAFAKAYWSLSTDGGAGLQSAASVNTTGARYTAAKFQQWQADRSNDAALATALQARQTLQDAVNVTNVASLYAAYQKTPDATAAAAYYKRNIGNVKTAADLIGDTRLLNMALTAYGIDPSAVSTDTVQKLLTEDPTKTTSVAYNNPLYKGFADAFAPLRNNFPSLLTSTSTVNTVVDLYQQKSFAKALASNTDAQNKTMFGTAGAALVKQIVADTKSENGLTTAAAYYGAHIAAARTATQFAADKQLTGIATAAFGLGNVSADVLKQLLTQDPNASTSLAQKDPQYLAFAKAFSYYATAGGRTSDTAAQIAAVETAYQARTVAGVVEGDIAAAKTQAARNTAVHEKTTAPLNLYQILGDSTLSTVLLGAYGEPDSVGALEPDQQIEIMKHAGFDATSLNSTKAIDSLIQRYMANVGLAQTPSSPLLTAFQNSDGQTVSLNVSSLFPSSSDSSLASSPTGYLLSLLT